MVCQNVARGRRAWQSSRSVWSKGTTVEDDATGATNGDSAKEYGFITDYQANPWWAVDLGRVHDIRKVHVYNRKGPFVHQERASPILIQTSIDGETWTDFFKTEPGFVFGVGDQQHLPLVCVPDVAALGQYVRITIPDRCTNLHLAEVEVYAILKPELAELPSSSEAMSEGTPSPESAIAQSSNGPLPNQARAKVPASKSRGFLSFLGW